MKFSLERRYTYEKLINIILIFSITFLCIPTSSINANEFKGNKYDHLSQKEIELLYEIYEIDPNFTYERELVAITKTVQVLETEEEYLKNYDGVLTKGAIGSNEMSIYVTASRVPESGKDTFNITATATWKMVPAFRMQDAFALAWADNFALISSSATASYKSIGVAAGKTNLISQSPNQGVGYSVECSDYYGQALEWVRINAKISKNDSSGIANVSSSYCHRKASVGGIGVSFGPGAGISFNVTGFEDQMANYTTLNY